MTTMTGAEFRATREHLGLTNAWLADYLEVAERSIVRWGDGQAPIPAGVAQSIEDLQARARALVAQHCELMESLPAERRELITYRTDDVLRTINPAETMPASWHRAIAARVRERIDGTRLVFAPEG